MKMTSWNNIKRTSSLENNLAGSEFYGRETSQLNDLKERHAGAAGLVSQACILGCPTFTLVAQKMFTNVPAIGSGEIMGNPNFQSLDLHT